MINYDGRRFCATSNTANGDTGPQTIFEYHQVGDIVWATYAGGAIALGTLIAKVAADGSLDMRYQHVSDTGEFKSGTCQSRVEVLADGRYRMHEEWQWSSPPHTSGRSVLEEIAE